MDEGPIADRAPVSAHAYATLVTNADYALGARALCRSIRHAGSTADIVVLHTGGVAAADLEPLREFGVRLARCALLPTSEAFDAAHARDRLHGIAPFTKGEKPAFHTPLDNFVKFRLWQMEEYARVVFIDADALALRNIDILFDYPEFSAAPNVYESVADFTRLNSGVFVATPARATYQAMLDRLDAPGAFWRRTDQSFLESFFPGWHGLPVYCNLLQYVWFNMPDLWDWGSVRVLHYQYEKPWQDHARADQLRPLIDLWHAYLTGENIPPDLAALPGPKAVACAS